MAALGLAAAPLLAANVRGALLASIVLDVLFAGLLLYNAPAVAVAAGPAMVPRRLPDILLGAAALAGGVRASCAFASVELAGVLGRLLAAATVAARARMTPRLAAAAAAATGPAFVRVAPLVGGLGGFMTGSDTGGNAMFARFQVETAGRAGLPPPTFSPA
jgi:hypothetical protein